MSEMLTDMITVRGIKPNEITFTILVEYYGKKKLVGSLVSLLDLMKSLRTMPDIHLVTIIIKYLGENKQLGLMVQFFDTIQRTFELRPNTMLLNAMLQGFIHSIEVFRLSIDVTFQQNVEKTFDYMNGIFDVMIELGEEANFHTMSILVSSFSINMKTLKLMALFLKRKQILTEKTIDKFGQACLTHLDLDASVELLKYSNIPLTTAAYKIIIANFHSRKQYNFLRNVIPLSRRLEHQWTVEDLVNFLSICSNSPEIKTFRNKWVVMT